MGHSLPSLFRRGSGGKKRVCSNRSRGSLRRSRLEGERATHSSPAHPTRSLAQTLFCPAADVSSPPFFLPSSFLLRQPTFPEGGERIRMSDDNQEWARESAVIYGKVQPAQLNEMRLMWMAKHHTREAFHKRRHRRLIRLFLLGCFTAVLEGNSSAVLVPRGAGDFPPPCNHSK